MRRSRAAAMVLIALAVVACEGDGGTSPTPVPRPAQIAGPWLGTWSSNTTLGDVRVDLTQDGSKVTGTWVETTAVSHSNGDIDGTVDQSSFAGTITYRFPNGPICSGTFSGPAGSSSLRWTSPAGFTTGDCGLLGGNPVNVVFDVHR